MSEQLTIAIYRALLEGAANKAEPHMREFTDVLVGACRAAKIAKLDQQQSREIAYAAVDRVLKALSVGALEALSVGALEADELLDERDGKV